MQIVLARLDDSQKVVKIGRVDIGEQHTFCAVKIPSACMWLNEGTAEDRAKAEKFAATEGYTVLCCEDDEDPLGRARRDIVKRFL